MSQIKLCKDCINLNEKGKCTIQTKPSINYVTGEKFDEWHPWRDKPSLQREDGFFSSLFMNTCGKRARFFEPKQESKP